MTSSNQKKGVGELTLTVWITLSLRVLLGAWFLFSGGLKIWGEKGLHGFADAIGNFGLLPEFMVVPAAYMVPWTEVFAGLLLMLGIWRRGVILVMAGLVVGFMVFVFWAWKHQLVISCGCTGGDEPIHYWLKAFELPGYLLVLAWLWWKGDQAPSLEGQKKENMA